MRNTKISRTANHSVEKRGVRVLKKEHDSKQEGREAAKDMESELSKVVHDANFKREQISSYPNSKSDSAPDSDL